MIDTIMEIYIKITIDAILLLLAKSNAWRDRYLMLPISDPDITDTSQTN
jgi:hypothetical protein